MDCEAFNDLLMDLVYDELDEVRSAAMRKHMDGCAECKQAHHAVTRGRSFGAKLELSAPPALSVDVIAALDAPTVSSVAVIAPPIEPLTSASHDRPGPRWLHAVGEFAMRRQVAMAAVFLLMVGFGLRYARHATLQPGTVIDSTDTESPAVIPATELSHTDEAPETRPTTPATAPQAHHAPSALPHRPLVPPRPSGVGSVPAVHPTAPPPVAMPTPSGIANTPVANAPSASGADPVVNPVPAPRTQNPYPGNRNSLDSLLPSAPNTQAFRANDPLAAAEQQANDFHRNGQSAQEIDALQRALAATPDDATRTRLTLRLITLLRNAGRHDEANALHARLTHREGSLTEIINELPPAPAAPPPSSGSTPSSTVHPSIARPSVARPRHPAMDSNMQNQGF